MSPRDLDLRCARLRVLEPGARLAHVVAGRLAPSRGQGMVEYGLVLLLVAIALIGSLIALQGPLETTFDNVTNGLTGGNPG